MISILIPTFNEQENIEAIIEAVKNQFIDDLPKYTYEIVVIDNDSKDKTRELIRTICERDRNVKAIFNAKNFGAFNSPYYGLLQTTGDCTILLCADFQDPVEMIPKMIHEWENGSKIVVCQKTTSQELPLMYHLRSVYYHLIKKMSQIEQIEHFTGFGLYDKSFLDVLRDLDDPAPFLRGLVAELGTKVKILEYEQQKRKAGKSKNNFFTLYDAAMLSITSYTKFGLRLALFSGIMIGGISVVFGTIYFIYKLLYWDRFEPGMAPLLIGMFFLGAIVLFFMGIMGEYIITINQRLMKRPLVIEEERLNF